MKSVTTSFQRHVYKIVLNRPDFHNAFNAEMIGEITEAFKNLPGDARVVHLSGAGKSFSAGADLNWMKSMASFTKEQNQADAVKTFEMFESVFRCRVPVVARVHGSVFGGGLGLVAAADIVACVRESKFCFSEAKLGLVPAVISSFVLRKAQAGMARQMMLTAQIFDDQKCSDMGLLQFVGSEEEVDDYIQSQIDFILANGPAAVRDTKHLLNYVPEHGWDDLKRETTRVIAERRVSSEGQEGMAAFFEKRKPSWKDS